MPVLWGRGWLEFGKRLNLVALAQWSALVVVLLALAAGINRGFGHTDEAYYIAWIRDPAAYDFLYQPFSHFFKPFYDLLDSSIVNLRLFGMALVAVSGATLGAFLENYYKTRFGTFYRDESPLAWVGIIFCIVFFCSWLQTPSYNLLANAGACLLAAGVLGWNTPFAQSRRFHIREFLTSSLVGLGGCISFFGKPTFAALGALFVLYMLYRTARFDILLAFVRMVSVGLTCLIPLYFLLSYTEPLEDFLAAAQAGMNNIHFGNSLPQIPAKTATDLISAPPVLLLSLAAVILSTISRSREFMARPIFRILLLAGLTWSLATLIYSLFSGFRLLGPAALSFTLFVIAYGLTSRRVQALDLQALTPVYLLLATPLAIAIGTANDIIMQLAVALFAILFGLTISARVLLPTKAGRSVEIGIACLVLLLFAAGAVKPYGLPRTMIRQTEPVDLGFSNDRLYVDNHTKAYLDLLRSEAARLGITSETPILDLSGTGPANFLIMGGRAPVFPWLVNFTDGAPILVDAVWRTMSPADRRRALLLGPVHKGMSGSKLVAALARDQHSYVCVGDVPMNHWGNQGAVLTIWRPRDLVTPQELQGRPPMCEAYRIVSDENEPR